MWRTNRRRIRNKDETEGMGVNIMERSSRAHGRYINATKQGINVFKL